MTVRILAFSGSARTGSWNQRLVALAAGLARESGADVTEVNLGDFDLPIFSEDLEAESIPPGVGELKKLAFAHDGYLIASPEYNGSVTPLLKNAIDWMSRKHGDEEHMAAYRGKVAAVMAASPGGLGGIRALPHLRYILEGVGTHIIPETLALGRAFEAFGEDGRLRDEGLQARLKDLAVRLVEVTSRLK